jgi:hypothetical protein
MPSRGGGGAMPLGADGRWCEAIVIKKSWCEANKTCSVMSRQDGMIKAI